MMQIDSLPKLVKLKIPARLVEKTDIAVTREDARGKSGALQVRIDHPGTASSASPGSMGW